MIAPVKPSNVDSASACPAKSSAPARDGVSATTLQVSQMPAAPIGRFTRKMLRQPRVSTSKPPSGGPADSVTLAAAVHKLIARARAAASLPQECVNNAREHGTTRAAPIPCRLRAAISAPTPGARPQPSDASANSISPHT